MIETFLPLLRKSAGTPRIENIDSGAGSIGLTLDPNIKGGPLTIPYKASKAALNMVGAVEVAKFREAGENVKLFTYCPGFCVSNLGPYNKLVHGAKPTEVGVRPVVVILNGEKDAEHGCCLNSEGGQHPW
jgi:NAD(P)-dependent dehydrogenase (short-subunit alcohol dehydrogenase family)